jgi:hypothetical protein
MQPAVCKTKCCKRQALFIICTTHFPLAARPADPFLQKHTAGSFYPLRRYPTGIVTAKERYHAAYILGQPNPA